MAADLFKKVQQVGLCSGQGQTLNHLQSVHRVAIITNKMALLANGSRRQLLLAVTTTSLFFTFQVIKLCSADHATGRESRIGRRCAGCRFRLGWQSATGRPQVKIGHRALPIELK